MKPKLKDLTNAVIDCGTNERLREVVEKNLWIPATKVQGLYGVLTNDDQIVIADGVFRTCRLNPFTTHHINDIEL
jgi:hypothetical protein